MPAPPARLPRRHPRAWRPGARERKEHEPAPRARGVDALQAGLLVLLAALAGAQNAVAGGGSFLTFPALLLAGVGPVAANATSTVALWPGSVASIRGYREDVPRDPRTLAALGGASLLGGLLGALLLLRTPEQTFARLIPFLLLGATLIFALGGRATRGLRGLRGLGGLGGRRARLAGVAALQLAIAVYGGYFGGGIGVLMLAGLAVLGMTDLHAMNGLKAVLGALINGVAVATFALAGVVAWGVALPMAAGAVAGGYGGARLARRVAPERVRRVVVAIGLALSALFFARSWLGAGA